MPLGASSPASSQWSLVANRMFGAKVVVQESLNVCIFRVVELYSNVCRCQRGQILAMFGGAVEGTLCSIWPHEQPALSYLSPNTHSSSSSVLVGF